MKRVLVCVGLTMCATVFSAAQRRQRPRRRLHQAPPPPPLLRGNPTPGTPQPEMPKPADRIALTGCVARAEGAAATFDANTPSDTRYLLTGAKREKRVPPGTGTSPAAAAVTGDRFRLAGIDSVDLAVCRRPRGGVRPGRDAVRGSREEHAQPPRYYASSS